MEEEKEVVLPEAKEEAKEVKPEKEYKLTSANLYLLFAIAAFAIMVIAKIFINFGVFNPVVHGVVSIIVYSLPLVGGLLSYMHAKKPTFEFIANAIALVLALMVL